MALQVLTAREARALFRHLAGGQQWVFPDLADLMAKASPPRSGDMLAGLGAESATQRVAARMALVPRTLEARGLDATPVIQEKLKKVGTPQAIATAALLDVILAEEIGHVAIGNRWYHWLCDRDGLNPQSFYAQEAATHRAPTLKPPYNLDARRKAGFSDAEIRAFALLS